MQVEFSHVRLIPIASVLASYKIETRKRNNTELVANCPFKSHQDSSHKQWTLAISTYKNKWYCHSDTCRAAGNHPKGGDVIDLVSRLENMTALDAAKRLADLFCIGNGQPTPSKADSEFHGQVIVNKPLAFELKGIDPDHPYIRERGISLETAMDFGIGFFPGKGSMAGRVVFPLHEDGNLVGYAGRTIQEITPENPKWRLPAGLVKSFIYGLDRCAPTKPVTLVESFWGVLWLHQNGNQAGALMGASMTEAQERRLDPFPTVIVALDNDDAGRAGAERIIERLRSKHKVSRAYLKTE